eukprot:360461-Chlamydomonas_euryale.AAC.1
MCARVHTCRFLRYATFDVLEPSWAVMESRVRRALSVDEAVSQHSGFLEAALRGLLLTRPRVTRAVCALLRLASTYCTQINRRMDAAEGGVPQRSPAAPLDLGELLRSVDGQLSLLVSELQSMYEALMHAEGGGGDADGGGDGDGLDADELAAGREELERLQSLMQRFASVQSLAGQDAGGCGGLAFGDLKLHSAAGAPATVLGLERALRAVEVRLNASTKAYLLVRVLVKHSGTLAVGLHVRDVHTLPGWPRRPEAPN